jgi:EAL domain-containing protein (putative c-di-GMP-specific phosphodiesterase class I)/GGDEF domain-containing protein
LRQDENTGGARPKREWDSVTRLLSKTSFLEEMDAFIASAEAEGTLDDYVLISVNICNFKYYNIKYGGKAGDRVMFDLASRLAEGNPDGLNGRFIGDRLAAVMRQQDAEEKIRALQQGFKLKYGPTGLTTKVGIFRLTPDTDALSACELAKLACDTIRNKPEDFCYYNEQIRQNARDVVYIVQNLDRAIRKGWIQIYYQPMVRTINGCLCGIEALARWVDPKRGVISPAGFIPVLEDNQLITRLDLYVLDQVCRGMRQKMAERSELVPVSINLSRLDFLNCDIFQEVEDSVRRYGIARDLLNLEVTESMVMEDSNILKREIKRFHDAGYKIFMDDFGSGYSSLNVLRDYEFDEIKLDMIFMRNFDEKAERVVSSAVSMAKGLGIEALAEGVETKAQYEFLKRIGCDKVQGYYISPPVPLDQFDALFEKSDAVEPRRFKAYYATVRRVNFLTDKPLQIVDFDGKAFRGLYANDEAQAVWQSLHFKSMDQVAALLNDAGSPYYAEGRDVLSKLRVDDPIRMEFDVYGVFLGMRLHLLAKEGEHRLMAIEVSNLGQKEEEDYGDENYIFRLLFTLYDEIYRINLKTQEFIPVKPGVNYIEMSDEWDKRGWKLDLKASARMFIQLEDQSDYIKFADPTTMRERMAKADRGILTQMFRSKGRNGAYVMKLHTIQPMPGSDCVLYSMQFVPKVQEQIKAKTWRHSPQDAPDLIQQDVWQTMCHSQTVNIFWKDKARRFVNVNDKFLETYGLSDRSEIVGKTDEDMFWHVDDGPYRNDELEVLQKGKTVVNHLGKCIIHGKLHNIVASKEPIYRDGEIVGLLGGFVPIDEVTPELSGQVPDNEQESGIDLIAVQKTLAAYMEGWEYRKEKFAAVSVQFDSYKRARQTYGEDIAARMLTALSDRIVDFCGNRTVVIRGFGEHFVMLMKYEDRETVEAFRKAFIARSRMVRELAGYAETLNPTVVVYYSEDARDITNMVAMAFQNKTVEVEPFQN